MEPELFELSDEERLFQSGIREFAERELAPIADEVMMLSDFSKPHFDRAFQKMREAGLTAFGIAPEYGGVGGSAKMAAILTEELCRIDAALGLSLGASMSLVASPISLFGSDSQKKFWLPRFARGELIGCYCQTTPDSGSDVAGIATKAKCRNGAWYVSGSKSFITNGSEANVALVLSRTSPEPHRGFTMFIVDMDRAKAAGEVMVVRNEHKAGLHASPTTELMFDECHADDILGNIGDGWKIAMTTLVGSRATVIPGQGIGVGQASFEIAKAYAASRVQFGKRLEELPIISWMLREIEAGVCAARFLTWRSALLKERYGVNSRAYQLEASVAKLVASDLAGYAPSTAMQILGGAGYTLDSGIAKFWHDGRIIAIYEGTSEIQKLIISRELLLRLVTVASQDQKFLDEWGSVRYDWIFGDADEEASYKQRVTDSLAKGVESDIRASVIRISRLRRSFCSLVRHALRDFPPASDAVTLETPWFFIACAYAYLEGAKLTLWNVLWQDATCPTRPERTRRHERELLRTSLFYAKRTLEDAYETLH